MFLLFKCLCSLRLLWSKRVKDTLTQENERRKDRAITIRNSCFILFPLRNNDGDKKRGISRHLIFWRRTTTPCLSRVISENNWCETFTHTFSWSWRPKMRNTFTDFFSTHHHLFLEHVMESFLSYCIRVTLCSHLILSHLSCEQCFSTSTLSQKQDFTCPRLAWLWDQLSSSSSMFTGVLRNLIETGSRLPLSVPLLQELSLEHQTDYLPSMDIIITCITNLGQFLSLSGKATRRSTTLSTVTKAIMTTTLQTRHFLTLNTVVIDVTIILITNINSSIKWVWRQILIRLHQQLRLQSSLAFLRKSWWRISWITWYGIRLQWMRISFRMDWKDILIEIKSDPECCVNLRTTWKDYWLRMSVADQRVLIFIKSLPKLLSRRRNDNLFLNIAITATMVTIVVVIIHLYPRISHHCLLHFRVHLLQSLQQTLIH